MERKNNHYHETTIHCGNVSDGFDKLKMLCEEEAKKLVTTLEISNKEVIRIPFWTSDFPELIGVGTFSRNESGSIVYELSFSESTL